jgi:hypothetical protein
MNRLFDADYKPWTPGDADMQVADSLYEVFFDIEARGTVNHFLGKKSTDFCKQFFGAINDKGEKIILINCFCKKELDTFNKWKTDLVIVQDGGNCFFKMKINVDKKEFYDVRINGYA